MLGMTPGFDDGEAIWQMERIDKQTVSLPNNKVSSAPLTIPSL